MKNADFGHQTALFENLSQKMPIFAPRRHFQTILSEKRPILLLLLKKSLKNVDFEEKIYRNENLAIALLVTLRKFKGIKIQEEYNQNTRRIQPKYKKNTRVIQEEYQKNTRRMQPKYKKKTRRIQGEYNENTTIIQPKHQKNTITLYLTIGLKVFLTTEKMCFFT